MSVLCPSEDEKLRETTKTTEAAVPCYDSVSGDTPLSSESFKEIPKPGGGGSNSPEGARWESLVARDSRYSPSEFVLRFACPQPESRGTAMTYIERMGKCR